MTCFILYKLPTMVEQELASVKASVVRKTQEMIDENRRKKHQQRRDDRLRRDWTEYQERC